MSCYNYIQINGLKHNNKDIFYKKVFENNLLKVTDYNSTNFNVNYIYYYKTDKNIINSLEIDLENNNENNNFKLLGKFIGLTKISIALTYYDVDCDAYQFDNETIFSNKIDNLYYSENDILGDENENNYELIDSFTYNYWQLYYKK